MFGINFILFDIRTVDKNSVKRFLRLVLFWPGCDFCTHVFFNFSCSVVELWRRNWFSFLHFPTFKVNYLIYFFFGEINMVIRFLPV